MAEPNATPPEGQPGTPPEGLTDQKLPTTIEELQALLQSESDKRVTTALQTAQAKFTAKLETEKTEAVRLAKMSADQRDKELFDKQKNDFVQQQSAFNREKLLNVTMVEMQKESLPILFAEHLLANTAEEVAENIKSFKTAWQDALQKAVDDRLKGTTPKAGSETKTTSHSFMDTINKNKIR